MYKLHKKQNVPISLQEAWDFLKSPKNLEKMTPKEMGFKIIDGAEKPTYAGQLISYEVTPLLGIKTKWVSKITQVEHLNYFTDEQLYGPYALWHHTHFIKEIEGGVEMEDLIYYKVPLGFLGRLFHPILVKPQLEKIFKFRSEKLIELFGEYKK
ncbi:MAG: cell division inhibitor [Polaribacter sp.]